MTIALVFFQKSRAKNGPQIFLCKLGEGGTCPFISLAIKLQLKTFDNSLKAKAVLMYFDIEECLSSIAVEGIGTSM